MKTTTIFVISMLMAANTFGEEPVDKIIQVTTTVKENPPAISIRQKPRRSLSQSALISPSIARTSCSERSKISTRFRTVRGSLVTNKRASTMFFPSSGNRVDNCRSPFLLAQADLDISKKTGLHQGDISPSAHFQQG